MKLRFLCANHRVLLQSDIKKALTVFQAGFDSGHYYFWQADWSEATPHLGCAFEVAELILTQTISQKDCQSYKTFLTNSCWQHPGHYSAKEYS